MQPSTNSLINFFTPYFEKSIKVARAVLNKPVFNIGVTAALSDHQQRNVKTINIISFITAFFAVSGTLLFYFCFIPDINIVLAGFIEAGAFAWVVALNRNHHYSLAALLFYLFHNVAIVYFGLKLDGDAGVQQVGFFMVGLSFLLFEKRHERIICISITAISLIGIELNQRLGFIHPFQMVKDNKFSVRAVVFPIGITLNAIVILLYEDYYRALLRIISVKNEALEKANLSKSIYVRETSHELRTPLNAVFGMAQLLYEDKQTIQNPDTLKRIDCLYAAAFQTLRIVNDVLDLSKIEAGYEIDNLFEKIPLKSCITELVKIPQETANYEDKKIQLDFGNDLPEYISFDKLSLTKIFNNLLSNAIKYTCKQGTIHIKVYAENYRIYCDITNPGVIVPQELDNLFKPFSGVKRNRIEGTGLGLFITKSLLEKLGGKIEARCDDVNTIFSFYFPLVISEAEVISKPVNKYNFKGYKILVVEDNPMSLYLLKSTVKKNGAEVLCAEDGKEALRIIHEEHPDLVITDSDMPVMGAVEMLQLLRADPQYSKLPVIVVTGRVFTQEKEDILKAGANECLIKPYQANDLYSLMDQQLGERSSIV
ncbi:response regulator [Chitinophaga sp. RAB17]|uniref:response regulator n=1 Tax=Chitinophaga sp. RAB17 TaxID=3233049 RepID=UPI003F90E6F6